MTAPKQHSNCERQTTLDQRFVVVRALVLLLLSFTVCSGEDLTNNAGDIYVGVRNFNAFFEAQHIITEGDTLFTNAIAKYEIALQKFEAIHAKNHTNCLATNVAAAKAAIAAKDKALAAREEALKEEISLSLDSKAQRCEQIKSVSLSADPAYPNLVSLFVNAQDGGDHYADVFNQLDSMLRHFEEIGNRPKLDEVKRLQQVVLNDHCEYLLAKLDAISSKLEPPSGADALTSAGLFKELNAMRMACSNTFNLSTTNRDKLVAQWNAVYQNTQRTIKN